MRKFFISLICAGLSVALGAQSLPSLLVPSDASALGAANTAVAADATAFAAESNMSMAVFSGKTLAAGLSYGSWAPKTAKDKVLGGSAWFKTGSVAFGLSFKSFSMQPYIPTSANGSVSQTDDPFTPKELSMALSGAFRLGDSFSLGVVARITNSALGAEAKATGIGVDLSASFVKDAFSAGLVLANLGTSVKYAETAYPQPAMLKAGAAYRIVKGLRVQADADLLFKGGFMGGLGVEYGWNEMIFARAGYHFGSGAQATASFASAGLGLHIVGITLDAAYVLSGENLGNTFMITLGYTF